MHGSWIVFLGLVLFGIYAWHVRQKMIRLRDDCKAAWNELETPLNRRYKLILLLVSVVQPFLPHLRDLLDQLVNARQDALTCMGATQDLSKIEEKITVLLKQILAESQQQPSLSADARFGQVFQALQENEQQLENACRFYNGNVFAYNAYIGQFPVNIVAGLFHFEPRASFLAEE